MAREINLVPDVKYEMVKALKLRNFILFLCIVVSAGAAAVALIFGTIAGGQGIALSNRDETLKLASAKINEYSDLDDFLTIQNQLEQLGKISDNKKVLSRTFDILSSLIPTGSDTIKISKLNVDLKNSTWTFEAQANAGMDNIDYRVLTAFEKSMEYMHYDFGRYVDKNGETIPTYCMVENDTDGAIFNDTVRGIYALRMIDVDGCQLADANDSDNVDNAEGEEGEVAVLTGDYEYMDYNGQRAVRIWRTPQYQTWYDEGKMDLDGVIHDVPHFESECTTYFSEKKDNGAIVWSSSNDICELIDLTKGDDSTPGIKVTDSSNGRDSAKQLVLRFSATIYFNPEVYDFNNKHLISIAPTGRHNVTDSYLQIQNMFSERASDCLPTDDKCGEVNTGEKDG